MSGHELLSEFTFARRCCATPFSKNVRRVSIGGISDCSCDAKNFCRSSNCLFLLVAGSLNLLTRLYVCQPPSPFCSLGELSSFVVRSWSPYHHCRPIQLSISTHRRTKTLDKLLTQSASLFFMHEDTCIEISSPCDEWQSWGGCQARREG